MNPGIRLEYEVQFFRMHVDFDAEDGTGLYLAPKTCSTNLMKCCSLSLCARFYYPTALQNILWQMIESVVGGGIVGFSVVLLFPGLKPKYLESCGLGQTRRKKLKSPRKLWVEANPAQKALPRRRD